MLAKTEFKGVLPKCLEATVFNRISLAWLHHSGCQENKPRLLKVFRVGVPFANLVWNGLLTKVIPPCAPCAVA